MKNQIIIAPQASITLREWPYFKELILKLLNTFKGEILIVGHRKDSQFDFTEKRIQNLLGETTLNEVSKLIEESRALIGNDSGLVHLSALKGVTTLVLMGPGNPIYIAPRGKDVRVMRLNDLPCSPCEKPTCHGRYGFQSCLKNLSVEVVFAEIVHAIQ